MSALKRRIVVWLSVVGIPFCMIVSLVTSTMALGFMHDQYPQEYEEQISSLLGVQGKPFSVGGERTWVIEDPRGRRQEVQSVLKPFYIEYWNGQQVLFYVPQEIWDATYAAYTRLPWCNPLIPINTAFSESTHYTNFRSENSATALGVWQFIRSTWDRLWGVQIPKLYPQLVTIFPNPDRTDIQAAAVGACVYLKLIGIFDAKSERQFINRFWGWNHFRPQAQFVWNLYQKTQEDFILPDRPDIDPISPKTSSTDWWKQPAISYLKWLNIWPETLAYNPDPSNPEPGANDNQLGYPYQKGTFRVSSGLHGQSYGHCAIDLAGGKGATVISPINGVVSQKYTDGLGNSVILIENSIYTVELLHGNWDVRLNDNVTIGDTVGSESNRGNTGYYDRNGQWVHCGTNSKCGYHTHFSVLRKNGKCVDPRTLINYPPK